MIILTDEPSKSDQYPWVIFLKLLPLVSCDEADSEKTESIKLDFFIDPDNPATKYSWHFAIYKYGFPEEWIKDQDEISEDLDYS
jgi:hypothetical protein